MAGVLQGESMQAFNEGIGLVLSRWSSLQTAVANEWGGRASHLLAQQLYTDILSWFIHSKEPRYIDDLENILYDGMLSLNVVIQDGSIEEVAEDLMIMHGECLEGNFGSVEKLRGAVPAAQHAAQIVNADGDVDDDDDDVDDDEDDENIVGDDNAANMDVDIPKSESTINSVQRPVNAPLPEVAGEADDGWVVVKRKNKGRKN